MHIGDTVGIYFIMDYEQECGESVKRVLKLLIFFAAVMSAALFPLTAFAETETYDTAAITERIYHESGADGLWQTVPEDAQAFLSGIGFAGFVAGSVSDISPQSFLEQLGAAVRDSALEPLRVLACLIAIVAISAALETARSGGAADGVLSVVISLCVVSVAAPPVLTLTKDMADAITASGSFMLLYVPVISGLMIASGKAAGGSMYSGVMIFVSSALMQLTVRVIVPLLKCVISLSLVSSACDKVRLSGVIELFRKASRFILTFCMSLFVAFLTMRTIVAAAADSLGDRAVKFAVSSFVPLVGGALSDAYQTVISCVNVLRSGVGAAAIAAVFAIFLPAALRCVLWQAVLAAGCAVCGLFGLSRVSELLSQLSAAVSVMFAVLMCTMVIYIISTAIIIIVGG